MSICIGSVDLDRLEIIQSKTGFSLSQRKRFEASERFDRDYNSKTLKNSEE